MLTINDFVNIFYSNFKINVDWDNINEGFWIYQQGFIKISSKVIASHKSFEEKIDLATAPKNKIVKTGESHIHMALKSIATDYLMQNLNINKDDIKYEYQIVGFEVDVIDKNFHFPTECGDVNALKLEKYLSLPATKSFFVIPYPHLKDVMLFEFQALPKFFDYIKFKNGYLNEQRSKFR